MPVLTRKILKEISLAFITVFSLLTLLMLLPFVDKYCQGLGFYSLLNLLPWIVLGLCKYTIVIATIITCTLFSNRYKNDREFLAVLSSGISLKAFTRPIIAFFFVITSFYLYLSHSAIPLSFQQLFEGVEKHSIRYLENEASKGFPMVLSHTERLFIGGVDRTNSEKTILKNITYSKIKQGKKIATLSAEVAEIGMENGNYVIYCSNYRYHTFDGPIPKKMIRSNSKNNRFRYVLDYKKKSKNKKKEQWSIISNNLKPEFFNILLTEEQLKLIEDVRLGIIKNEDKKNEAKKLSAKHLTLQQLKILQNYLMGDASKEDEKIAQELIKNNESAEMVLQIEFEFIYRWINCLLTPLLAWIGFFMGIAIPWHHRAASFVASLVPFGLYFFILLFFQSQIQNHGWPLWSIWFTLAVMLLPGIICYKTSKKTGYH